MLVFDVTIAMSPDKNISANKLDRRKKAYNVLKNDGKYVLVLSKSYGIVGKEMWNELDRLMGGGIKKNVKIKHFPDSQFLCDKGL